MFWVLLYDYVMPAVIVAGLILFVWWLERKS